jgi:predicted exporter
VTVLSRVRMECAQANLLHAVGLVIVMGMGVDYGSSSSTPPSTGGLRPTLVSCLLCCLTTILGFGALALSDNLALRSLGVTTAAGVALSLLFAPVTLLALRADAPRAAHA